MAEYSWNKTRDSDLFRVLVLSGVVSLAAFIASQVQSSGSRVSVREITLPTQNGQWVTADLFKPHDATAENPAPLVVVVPGFQRSKETLSNISIELARRGIVVFAIDPYGQGLSSSSLSTRSATTEGYGMFAVVDYAHDTNILSYVDRNRIGAMGHSAGGNAAIRGASYFGREAQRAGRPSKLHSVFVSGYVLTLTDQVLKDVRSNVGMSYARYDEGAYRNELQNADMRRAPEALRLVNSGLIPSGSRINKVEIGHYYGEKSDRTLRVVFNERVLHPFQPYDITAIANQIDYFEKVFSIDSGLSSRNQIWYWKEILTFVSLLASLLTLVPLARLFMRLPFFASLAQPVPEPSPRPQGKGRTLFWGTFAFSALVACFTYIPMSKLSQILFVDASSRRPTWFFPQRMNNAVLLWAVVNGLLGLLVFYLNYRLYGRKRGDRPERWGIKISVPVLGKTFLLAGSIFCVYYMLLFTVYYFFHVDYRFIFMGVRPFQPAMIVLLGMYAPLFFIFFVSNSLRVNGAMRFQGEGEGRSRLRAGLASCLGLLLIVVIQYSVFAATGTVYWTDGWLYVNLLFAVVPMIFVLPYFNRAFFLLTGNVYLGAMTVCLIFIMILLSNTVCYIPI